MVARRWAADEFGGHFMELLDTVANDGPQTIQDATGRLFDVVPRQAINEYPPLTGLRVDLESMIDRRRAERANLTAEEIREDDEFHAEFQRNLEEARQDTDTDRNRPIPFAWVDEASDEEFQAWVDKWKADHERRQARVGLPRS